MDKNRLGLMLGAFFALSHALWSLAVAFTQSGMQKLIDWVMSLHFLAITIKVEPFRIVDALTLIALTFVIGYAIGYVFAAIANLIIKK